MGTNTNKMQGVGPSHETLKRSAGLLPARLVRNGDRVFTRSKVTASIGLKPMRLVHHTRQKSIPISQFHSNTSCPDGDFSSTAHNNTRCPDDDFSSTAYSHCCPADIVSSTAYSNNSRPAENSSSTAYCRQQTMAAYSNNGRPIDNCCSPAYSNNNHLADGVSSTAYNR